MAARPVLGLQQLRAALLVHLPATEPGEGQAGHRTGIVTTSFQLDGEFDDDFNDAEDDEPGDEDEDDDEDDDDDAEDDDVETWQVSLTSRSETA